MLEDGDKIFLKTSETWTRKWEITRFRIGDTLQLQRAQWWPKSTFALVRPSVLAWGIQRSCLETSLWVWCESTSSLHLKGKWCLKEKKIWVKARGEKWHSEKRLKIKECFLITKSNIQWMQRTSFGKREEWILKTEAEFFNGRCLLVLLLCHRCDPYY